MTELHTICLHSQPNEVIYSSRMQHSTRKRLSCFLPNAMFTLLPHSHLWSPTKSRLELKNGEYFASQQTLPQLLQRCWDDDLVLGAVGVCLGYLKRLRFESDVVTSSDFIPLDCSLPSGGDANFMVMDATLCYSMNVFESCQQQGLEGGRPPLPPTASGTILSYLDHCVTPVSIFFSKKIKCLLFSMGNGDCDGGLDILCATARTSLSGREPSATFCLSMILVSPQKKNLDPVWFPSLIRQVKEVVTGGDVERAIGRIGSHAHRVGGFQWVWGWINIKGPG